MLAALRRQGLDISILPWEPAPLDLRSRVERMIFSGAKQGHEWAASRDHARAVEASLQSAPVDVIFSVAASTQAARLRTAVPIVSATDTTFRSVTSVYPAFAGLSWRARQQGEWIDRRSARKAARLVYPSRWAADAVIAHCGVDPRRVVVTPYGPNLPAPDSLPARGLPLVPTVLFVGVDWRRKGGDTLVAAVRQLRARGRDLRLICVGSDVPVHAADAVDAAVAFDKSVADGVKGLQETYLASDVLVLPSQADCSPIVICEAAAYGLPVLASGVGGIPELVVDGLTGRVLPVTEPPEVWADALDEILQPERYASMSVAARSLFEQSHNWDSWGEQVASVLREAAATSARPGKRWR
jgi:glycosyltransferase involved in cell wall biosynthesis